MRADHGAAVARGSDRAPAVALGTRFATLFGSVPRLYRAPGRVNLIGEHTDYNDGFVLPAALALACHVAALPRDDGRLIVRSEDLDDGFDVELESDAPRPSRHWSDYVRGVAAVLRGRGHALRGATLMIRSEVPLGAGLSSSAALEVGVATALLDLAGITVPPTEVALMCQQAEHEYVGSRCGVMDQFVACHGRAGAALLLDCRSLAFHTVPLPPQLRLVVCNTMVRHSVAAGAYKQRVTECSDGVTHLARANPAVRSLRDADPLLLESCRRRMSDVTFRRCRHVISENQRAQRLAGVLERGDLAALGSLMLESHRSLRDDYEVSCPELDALVDIADTLPGVYGTRMTGAGFGGCTVNLVHADAVDEFRRRIELEYEARIGTRPGVYASETGAGAARVDRCAPGAMA